MNNRMPLPPLARRMAAASPLITSNDVSAENPLPTSPASWRLPAIDGFRALAMLMVFACHAWTFAFRPTWNITFLGRQVDLFAPFPHGAFGVDLFMVLSGFCLFFPLCKSEQALAKFDWREFYRRRIRRIVPPYYAAIGFATLLPFVLVGLFHLLHLPARWQPLPASPLGFLTHLLFLHTLVPGMLNELNLSLWSMGLEAQFYFLFPFVIWGVRRFHLRFLAVMVAAATVYSLIIAPLTLRMQADVGTVYSLFFLGHWQQFAAGMLAAWIVAQHRRSTRLQSARRGNLGLGIAFLLYVVAVSLPPSLLLNWLTTSLLAVAFALAIVCICVTRSPLRRLLENPVMERLGYISYSIFLIHWPVDYYFRCLLQRFNLSHTGLFAGSLFAGFVLTLAIAYPFFLIFERPFMNAPSPERRDVVRALLRSLRLRQSAS